LAKVDGGGVEPREREGAGVNGDAVARASEQAVADLVFRLPAELLNQLVAEVADRALEQAAERLRLETEPYIDTKQAAEYLACKPQRIHELTSAAKLAPAGRDGARLLFRRSDLDAYLKGCL
jgi:excisionase family DNA binding protein